LNYGSSFWPSPQQRWGWPPIPEIDSEPYEVTQASDGVRFVSRPAARAKVTVTKQIRAIAADESIEITYGLKNDDGAPVSWAAWEITRVAASGLSFFPTGERQVSTQLPVVEQGDITWFQHDPSKLGAEGQKFTGDGAEGWLAHLAGNTLLIKQFADVPVSAQAPAPEAEIAIYAAKGYVEVEPQGPFQQLMPGQELSWTVRWSLVELPAGMKAELGSSALVELVRGHLASARK
jgi:hypothetical protein